MKKVVLLSAIVALTLTAKSDITPKELRAIENADLPVHHYFAFGPAGGKVTRQQLEYYKSVGLLKRDQAIRNKLQKIRKNKPAPSKEAIEGVAAVIEGVAALEKNDLKDAQKYLTKAVGFFDTALKNNPSLKLLPVAGDIDVTAHDITLDEARKIKQEAITLLKEDKQQEAITLLSTLVNQITVTDTYIPMGLYPVAVKKALTLVQAGKKEQALAALEAAFDTVVSTTTVIPLSLVVAQMALDDTQKRASDQKKEAATLLKLAKEELQLAQLEGYISSQDAAYQLLLSEIAKLQKNIASGNIKQSDYTHAAKAIKTLVTNAHKPHPKQQ